MQIAEAVKRVILENWRHYGVPITLEELARCLASSLGRQIDLTEVKAIVERLKNGGAVKEQPIGSYRPLYNAVND